MLDLADASGDSAPSRVDEPYRRALSGIYARLCATYAQLVGEAPPRPSRLSGQPYASPESFRRDLVTIASALASEGQGALSSGGALGRLIRAVETFGFHLATLDLRQNSDVHERVVAELLREAGVAPAYLEMDEAARVALLSQELSHNRPLGGAATALDEEASGELAIVHAAAHALETFGPGAITTYIISKTTSLSDLLEVYVLLKEAGLYRIETDGTPVAPIMVVPLFETIGDLEAAPDIMAAFLRCPR